MIVSTILLSADDYYVDKDGNLPYRPEFDKKLLRSLTKGQIISYDAAKLLPPSIRSRAVVTDEIEPTIGITIPEIDGLTDLLLVVRGLDPLGNGKKFRFDRFENIVKLKGLEIWMRK